MPDYRKSSTVELLSIFAKAAAEQGEALRAANPKKANSRYRTMEKVYCQLKDRGFEARTMIATLFDHPDGYVRLNAAAYALEWDSPGALRVLQIINKMESGLLGFTAGMAIKEWHKKHSGHVTLSETQ